MLNKGSEPLTHFMSRGTAHSLCDEPFFNIIFVQFYLSTDGRCAASVNLVFLTVTNVRLKVSYCRN
jgi:hypothetical protein